MIDVEQRARRAGEAARTEAAARAHHLAVPTAGRQTARQHGPRRAARPVVGAVAGACVVLLVVLLTGRSGLPGIPIIDAAGPDDAVPDLAEVVSEPVAVDGALPVPPVGEAIPAYLEDGTPVFVSHPEEGEVRVVGALNPHVVGWGGKLVAWCPSSGWFEDLYHSATFNAWGDYTGGPAPYALPDHEAILSADGTTVQVTGAVDHTRDRADRRAEQPPAGPACGDGYGDPPTETGATVHEPPLEVPRLDGTDLPRDRWVWAEVRLGGAPGDPRVCDVDGSCPAASPRLAGVRAGTPVSTPVDLVLRGLVGATDEGVVVLLAAEPEWETGELASTRGPSEDGFGLLPLPEPGEVLSEWYGPAGTPVFVARDEDGGVHVLDAASPEAPSELLGWCASTGRFVDGRGPSWGAAGEGVGGAWTDLGRYPAEVVTQGELRGVRITGELEIEWSWTGNGLVGPATIGPDCTTVELVRHLPGERTVVRERGRPGGVGPGAWSWVRMEVALVDGELLLCAIAGPQDCGEPGPEPDPTSADCWDDIGPGGLCPPEEDPVVVSAGVGPTDGPELLLVRGSDDGRTVEVRRPATAPPG